MEPSCGESGTDPPEAQRRFQKDLPERPALFIIVTDFPFLLEGIGAIDIAIVDEFGGKDLAVFLEYAIFIQSLNDDFAGVVSSQIRSKIDVPGENVGELQGKKQIFSALSQGRDQVPLN